VVIIHTGIQNIRQLFGGAMIAGMALGNPSVGQTVGGDPNQTDIEQQDVKGITTITLTEINFAHNEVINIDVPSGNNLKIQETSTSRCYVYTTNWDLLGQCPWQSNNLYNDTTFWVIRENNTVTINVNVLTTDVNYSDVDSGDIVIYPNPTTDVINIKSNFDGQYEIIDIKGRVITKTKDKSIDVSQLSPGKYFIRVGGKTKTFIKE
jgi:hypothetical protein